MLKTRITQFAAIALLSTALLAGCGNPASPANPGPGESPTRTAEDSPDITWPTAIPAGARRPVIIDTDMAADDWMAILFLLRRPDIDVLAISVTGAGEAHCEAGVRNALGLLELAGHRSIHVACGRETPLQGNHAFPAEWRAGVENLMGLSLPERGPLTSTPPAPAMLASEIESADEKVTLLSLGPLTNVAEALQASPGIAEKIEAIYVMGGAVTVPGNVGTSGAGIDNSTAEWNLYIDPRAAAVVLGAPVPVVLVPLDVTNQVPLTARFVERLEKEHGSPEASFVYDLIIKNREMFLSGGYSFWDPLAAAIVADNSLAGFRTFELRVVEEEGKESGRTVVAAGGRSVNVAVAAGAQRFEEMLLAALNRR